MPILEKMFIESKKSDLFEDHMFALFDQQFQKPSPEITGEKWGMIRDLDKIWSSDQIKNHSHSFGPKNTLLLESDEVSVFECFQNSLIFDKYDRGDVWP